MCWLALCQAFKGVILTAAVMQVCDDSQRQLLMARITIHLNQLKKLTYGKHIVARVEKLLVAGNAATVQQVSCQPPNPIIHPPLLPSFLLKHGGLSVMKGFDSQMLLHMLCSSGIYPWPYLNSM